MELLVKSNILSAKVTDTTVELHNNDKP